MLLNYKNKIIHHKTQGKQNHVNNNRINDNQNYDQAYQTSQQTTTTTTTTTNNSNNIYNYNNINYFILSEVEEFNIYNFEIYNILLKK